jgi:DNA-nicking Smr family endonuclease
MVATLDGRWDRQLATGDVIPDRVVDLHGCTLETAHRRTLRELEGAVRDGDRIVVLVTGKAPLSGSSRLDAPLRGIIRASIADWIAASPIAAQIAAIRPAHRRHGGDGAIYVILRRANRPLA